MTQQLARTRATAIAAGVIGLFGAALVFSYFHFGAVMAAIRPIRGVDFLTAIGAQIALFIPLGIAWWLVAPVDTGRTFVFIWARLTREAAADVLPFSQLAGVALAARSMVLGGASASVALGSIGVDITLEMIAQLIYTLLGVVLLVRRLGSAVDDDRVLVPLVGGLAIAAIIVGGFVATQQRGLKMIERLAHRLVPSVAGHATAVTRVIEAAYGKPFRLWKSLGLHVIGWLGSAGGTWLILRFIDHPLSFLSVAAIESLMFTVRNAAFVIPSGLGVQEGAYALLGPIFGLPAQDALALSLLKRARDISIGLPVLLIYQLLESRALSSARPKS